MFFRQDVDLYSDVNIGSTPEELAAAFVKLRNDFDSHVHNGYSARKHDTFEATTISASTFLIRKTSFSDTKTGMWAGIVNNLMKLKLGSSTSYLEWDGTQLNIVGSFTAVAGKYIEKYTAGESLASGNPVCLKPQYTDFVATHDAQTYQNSAGTNYGSDTTMQVGNDSGPFEYISFIKFNMASIPLSGRIAKAEIRLHVQAMTGAPTTLDLALVTSADWDESTLTYTNRPSTGTPNTGQSWDASETVTQAGDVLVYDVTQLVRHWKDGFLNNYGMRLLINAANTIATIHTSEGATATQPVLRIYDTEDSDGKVYKADASDYMLCRNIVGITQEAASSDEEVDVQTHGQVTNLSSGPDSGFAYLNESPGSISNSAINLARIIKLGKYTSSTKMILNINDQDVLIERIPSGVATFNSTTNTQRIYCLNDTRYARVIFCNSGSDPDFIVDIYRADGAQTVYNFQAGSVEWIFTFASNYLEIDPPGSGSPLVLKVEFYT